ncbi:MAG: Alcohol dehydrogenase zinc-binding domain protein [Gemmatimonadetes bacterium]|nr:Alcohol dehydrogenase zinc-binding domain protein [Gemmatimonadota bacterium]
MRLETVADPAPAAGEVLVRMDAIGLNFIEVYFRKGLYKTALPFIPGTEGAGTVVALGDGVTDVQVGDRVASTNFVGSYAELSLVKADRLVPLPAGVSARIGAAAMLQGMTAHYLTHSVYTLRRGDWCLVHAAAGGVGLILCQIAARIGARVIGTVSTPEKAALARVAGAEATILYTQQNFVDKVKTITGGAKVKVVYDSVGAATFLGSMDCLAVRGMLALFGQSSGPVAPFDPTILNAKGSLFVTRPTLGHYIATRAELEWRAGDILGWVNDRSLDIRIDREIPLERVAEAHEALEARLTTGKVVIVP